MATKRARPGTVIEVPAETRSSRRRSHRPPGSSTSRPPSASPAARPPVRRCPRGSHAQWHPSATRPDPIGILEQQARDPRAGPVPIRYGRMLVSPFTFYRGAAAIMASDLSDGPRTALYTQLCGDAHLMNFGTYAAPDRRMVFGINDFDETLPGPFEWDVKRLVGELRGRGPRSRLLRQGPGGDQPRRGARLPRGDGGLRAGCATSTSGTPASTSRSSIERHRSAPVAGGGRADGAERREGAHQGQPQGVREADAHRRRRAADRRATRRSSSGSTS